MEVDAFLVRVISFLACGERSAPRDGCQSSMSLVITFSLSLISLQFISDSSVENCRASIDLTLLMGKVQANIHFLAPNSQYKLERPYILRYSLDGQPHSDGTIPSTNVSFQSYRVVVHDLRSSGPAGLQDYEIDGVAILRFSSALSYEDFQDHNKVRQVYLEELTQHVKIRLGATQVFVIPHLIETEVPGSNARFALYKIRKRHVDFPQSVGKAYQYEQPASVANVGEKTRLHVWIGGIHSTSLTLST